ncbi:hypothetical protein EYF80_025029 [Liparis tanakae]|uniref:Uncharacterized protein n=1 Tax=Liparis tanakae TaxID=230148 RepID=A0A4Z2HIF4_9TELE|nr:hypothetical protein EYF80_025029 [Liparis tanakae]
MKEFDRNLQSQEVRFFTRPIWSALPLFGSGTKNRIRVPAVIPKTGETYRGKERMMRPLSVVHEAGGSTDADVNVCEICAAFGPLGSVTSRQCQGLDRLFILVCAPGASATTDPSDP